MMLRIFAGAVISFTLAACGAGDNAAPNQAQNQSAAGDPNGAAPNVEAHGLAMAVRDADSATGRALFIDKGCVICHSVNGVGGKAATPLDVEIGVTAIDPLEFAARMWRGAPAMIELQSIELGYSIYLTADEISHLAAFASDRAEQALVMEDNLPDDLRNGLLDQQFWEMEDWDDFLRAGQESVPESDRQD